MPLAPSELILNPDGSIYHINLKPGEVAPIIITVGDPDRVEKVTRYFDSIELTRHKREFKAQTGTYKNKRITVISTGIGTDNIDIVLNELDALVNVDFASREIKKNQEILTLIRIGTTGAIQPDIPVDSFLVSEKAIGFDSLLHFYDSTHLQDSALEEAFIKHTSWTTRKSTPYVVDADSDLLKHFSSDEIFSGFTATNVGFYGPQGRVIRGKLQDADLNKKLESFRFEDLKISNLEMETSGIYGLAKLLGHKAISLNSVLANRALGTFSNQPEENTDRLIQWTLKRIAQL